MHVLQWKRADGKDSLLKRGSQKSASPYYPNLTTLKFNDILTIIILRSNLYPGTMVYMNCLNHRDMAPIKSVKLSLMPDIIFHNSLEENIFPRNCTLMFYFCSFLSNKNKVLKISFSTSSMCICLVCKTFSMSQFVSTSYVRTTRKRFSFSCDQIRIL